MNQEEFSQIVQLKARKYVMVQQGKIPSKGKHNTTSKWKIKSPLARILKLHGTCVRKVFNSKLTI